MDAQSWTRHVIDAVGKVIYGKEEVIEKLLVTLLCRGHALLEDVPGVGKTILARALSTCLGGQFSRVQCTPDLLPADVLGVSIYNQDSGQFEFREGPIMTNVLLVDEINRATPRTQSALLEAMSEGQISVEGRTNDLPDPFFMLATENPVEFEGTFPLPEVQRDRFFLTLRMGYPAEQAEREIMAAQRRLTHPVTDLTAITELQTVLELQREVAGIEVPDAVSELILGVVEATRGDSRLTLGASPRASMALYKGAQALAAVRGRGAATIEDVQELAPAVLMQRITVKPEHLVKGVDQEAVISAILTNLAEPAVARAG
jgi:MoxR-like ATPase